MNAQDIDRAVRRLGREIAERANASGATRDLAIVGIRRGGVFLAQRLRAELAAALGAEPPAGTLGTIRKSTQSKRPGCFIVCAVQASQPVDGLTSALM